MAANLKQLPPTARLFVRADANAEIGTGHVLRALALAQEWLARGGRACFFSACDSVDLVERVRSAGIQFVVLDDVPTVEDQVLRIREIEAGEAPSSFLPWVMLDGYHLHRDQQQAFRAAGFHVLFMDDQGEPASCADIVVNQNPGAETLPYARGSGDTEYLLGTRYAILRQEFRELETRRDPATTVKNVLITFGGADPCNATAGAIRACAGVPGLVLRVIVGAANPRTGALRSAIAETGVNAEVLTAVSDMAEQMEWADLAISAAGTTCWEMARLGLPAIVMAIADNQRLVAEGVGRLGVAVNLGDVGSVTGAEISRALRALIGDPERRSAMSSRGRDLIDGHGVRRVVGRMRARQVSFRKARPEDSRWVWSLSNDPAVRSASFHDAAIPWETHESWFERKIGDEGTTFWIAETDRGARMAQVRFEADGAAACMSVSLLPEFRGAGLGRLLIQRACDEYRDGASRRILARIREQNQASIQAFQRAGFGRLETCTVNGKPVIVLCARDGELLL